MLFCCLKCRKNTSENTKVEWTRSDLDFHCVLLIFIVNRHGLSL